MKAKETGGNFEPTPAGIHHAVCYGVIDIGTQHNPVFDKSQRKCIILWELSEEKIEIEGVMMPRAASKFYTLSLNERANLRHDLESWRGRAFTKDELKNGFELRKLLGVNCQLNIVHNEKSGNTYANVAGVVPVKKGMPNYHSKNPEVYFSFDEDMEIPDGIPDWIMSFIQKSKEHNEDGQMNDWPDGELPDEPSQHGDDDIPF